MSEAADRYGVGLTHFKTICRRNGIDRWPKRKLDSALQVRAALGLRLRLRLGSALGLVSGSAAGLGLRLGLG